jgi:hypothetical protein
MEINSEYCHACHGSGKGFLPGSICKTRKGSGHAFNEVRETGALNKDLLWFVVVMGSIILIIKIYEWL